MANEFCETMRTKALIVFTATEQRGRGPSGILLLLFTVENFVESNRSIIFTSIPHMNESRLFENGLVNKI